MADNPYLMDEKNVPANWEPADTPSAGGAAAPPLPNDMPQFFSGSMPPQLQHDTSFVGTEVGTPRIPKYSLMPFGIQGNPSTNAAIASTASKTSSPSSSGSSGMIGLNIPSTFSPMQQTVILPGPLAFDWGVFPYGEVLATPPITGAGAYIDEAFGAKSSVAAATFSMGLTPTQANEVVFTIESNNTGAVISPGWTGVPGAGSIADYQIITAVATVPVTYNSSPSTPNWAGGMFSAGIPAGGSPTFVQSASGNISFPYTGTTVTFGTPITAGNAILLFIAGSNSFAPYPGPTASVTDSQGNAYDALIHEYNDASGSLSPNQSYVFVFVATEVVTGATSVQISWTSTPAAGSGAAVFAVEVSGLSKLIGKPTFRRLVASDLSSAIFYQTVESNGTAEPQEPNLNFSADFTVTDAPLTKSTNIALAVASIAPAIKINGVGTSPDKQFFINGVTDGATVWGVNINGASG